MKRLACVALALAACDVRPLPLEQLFDSGVLCSTSNCAGCCTAAGFCVTGNASTACGARGSTCAACLVGQVCSGAACVFAAGGGGGGAGGSGGGVGGGSAGGQATCDPVTCNGCCAEDGGCATGTQDLACGPPHTTCVACAAGTGCQSNGTCACTAVSCPNGCCSNGACTSPQTNARCGFAGQACSTCPASQTCNAPTGTCVTTADGGFGVCEQGWCWLNPYPMGGTWSSVAYFGAGDFWTASSRGAFAHWLNGNVTLIDAGFQVYANAITAVDGTVALSRFANLVSFYEPLTGNFILDKAVVGTDYIDSSGSGTTFACGSGGCTRIAGAAPESMALPTSSVRAMTALGAEALVVNDCTTAFRFDGTSYVSVPLPNAASGYCSLSGNARDDLVFTDTTNQTYVFDGGSWTPVGAALAQPASLFPGRTPGRVWASMAPGRFDRFDNGAWTAGPAGSVNDIEVRGTRGAAAGNDNVFELNGTTAVSVITHRIPYGTNFALTGTGLHDVWVVMDSHLVYRCDLGNCRVEVNAGAPLFMSGGPVTGIYTASNAIDQTRWFDGTVFHQLSASSYAAGTLVRIAAAGRDDVFALTNNGTYEIGHWQGVTWAKVPSPAFPATTYNIAWAGELWVLGTSVLMQRHNDGGWVDHGGVVDGGQSVFDAVGVPGDVDIVGSMGLMHFDGAQFRVVQPAFSNVFASSGPDDRWLAGNLPLRHRNSDGGWSTVNQPPTFDARHVFPVRDAGVFLGNGFGGLIYHP